MTNRAHSARIRISEFRQNGDEENSTCRTINREGIKAGRFLCGMCGTGLGAVCDEQNAGFGVSKVISGQLVCSIVGEEKHFPR
ncbi:MAG: hypothetical protein EOM40_13055 [Clostridia bacterium]|nr:hypothetical protein [Clostridia bacterium]NCC44259.1 hypothetical protein [Clostridia bacterium]